MNTEITTAQKMMAATTPIVRGIQNTTTFPRTSSGMLNPSARRYRAMWLISSTAGAFPTLPENPLYPWPAIVSSRRSGVAKIAAYPRPASVPKSPRTSRMLVSTTSQVRRLRTGGAYDGAYDGAAYVGTPYGGGVGAPGAAGAGAAGAAETPGTPYGLVASTAAYSPYFG